MTHDSPTMGKRPREETNASIRTLGPPGDGVAKKRARLETTSKEHTLKAEKLKKHKRRPEESGLETDGSEATREAKARRKALKREKKERKRANNGDSNLGKPSHPERRTAFEHPTSPDSSTPANASAVSSVAQSRGNSSVTSPEPDHAAASDCYTEPSALRNVPQAKIDSFLTENSITIADPRSNVPSFRPIIDFNYLPVASEAEMSPFATFTSPTPIQAAAWPYLLSGRDVIGIAETGSGKTLAFGLPCIRHIVNSPQSKPTAIKAVVVSPTRELALQIHEQLVRLAKPSRLQAVCVYGGVPKGDQITSLKSAHIVVATPGRLNDLLNDRPEMLSSASYVVLDEADRMLDKGFEEDIRKIIAATAPASKRQTLMFTATWPPSVRDLADSFMKQAVKITIGDSSSGELRANTRIQQIVEVVNQDNKQTRLFQLLKDHQRNNSVADRILVFCLYKKEATRIEHFIRNKGFKVTGIHGDLSQDQRLASLGAFKKGDIPILVATDVAARGLDIPAVKLVINVTFPLTAEDYVHRIGRTGRAGAEGKAITLFTEHDKALSGALINVLKAAKQPVPEALLKFGCTVKKRSHEVYGDFVKDVDMSKKASKITFD